MHREETSPKKPSTSRPEDGRRFGVIFDLDGTLADTLGDITATLNVVLNSAGRQALAPSDVRPMIGLGLANLLGLALGIDDETARDVLVEQYRVEYKRRLLELTRLFPRIDAVLNMLQAASVPMCVLSNKPTEFALPICDALLADWPFVRCTGPVEGMARKPDPELALQLATQMDREPGEVYFVGDSAEDIETATNAGMTSIAVTWGYREREQLRQANPDHMVNDADALRLLLQDAMGAISRKDRHDP